MHWRRSFFGCLLFLWVSPQAHASATPQWDRFHEVFETDALDLDVLMQVVGDWGHDVAGSGPDGFSIANARLKLSGHFDEGTGYLLQAKLDATPALLDAAIRIALGSDWVVDVGQFKAPFSAEKLVGAANIDFVNRAHFVEQLAPGRQIGIQVRHSGPRPDSEVRFGIFNGNGTGRGNDDDRFLYVARGELASNGKETAVDELRVGASVAFSQDSAARIGGLDPAFDGTRFLMGADARWRRDRWVVAAEAAYGDFDADANPSGSPWGAFLTIARGTGDRSQWLLRFERFDADGWGADVDRWTLGYNLWPTTLTEFQVNYLVDTDLEHHQILVNFQVAF